MMTLTNTFRYFFSMLLVSSLIFTSSCISLKNLTSQNKKSKELSTVNYILDKANWDPFNHAELSKLISHHGKKNPSYDSTRPPYVVFDFDNTSIYLDIEEAVFIYQLENLLFKVDPKTLNSIIRQDIGLQDFKAAYNNKEGQPVNINKISADIIESYQWLYHNYRGLNGKHSLQQVKLNPHYHNFRTKMRYLYDAIGESFDQKIAYAWVTYLFAGFKENEVRTLTRQTYLNQLNSPIEQITWVSPQQLRGQAGVISVKWNNGLRAYTEMQSLYHVLKSNGFDVYICSASFSEVIKEMATNPYMQFNVPETQVFAFELERDEQNKISPKLKKDYIQTLGKGKSETIQKFLINKYGYGPILVAGDSHGDLAMMQDFKDTQKVLIINRLNKTDYELIELYRIAVQQNKTSKSKFLLQGRDANTGRFIPTFKSIAQGSHTSEVFTKPSKYE